VKRIVCAADRASTIVHGIWDDIKMVTREVQVSKWQILVVSLFYLRFSVMILLWIIETGIRIRHIHIMIHMKYDDPT
jgi:hypothetical protein